MILLIVIPIALAFLVFFGVRNVLLYRKSFGGFMGGTMQSVVYSYNVLHAPPAYKPLEVSHNFFNFTANLILKFIHFIIFAVVTYVFRDIKAVGIVLTAIYSIFTALAYLTYSGRRAFYNEIADSANKRMFTPIFKASICIPLYQTIILGLLIFV